MMRVITVVGASLAGLSATRALRDQGFDGQIIVVGDELHAPYDRPPLSKEFLAGTVSEEDLRLQTPEDEALQARWLLGHRAAELDVSGRAVVLDNGERIATDAVVVATGARARCVAGQLPSGVHTLRTLDDSAALRKALVPGSKLVVVGAGFVGAEVASTAMSLGLDVQIVEAGKYALQGPLGEQMGAVCGRLHEMNGVGLRNDVGLAEILGNREVTGVRLTDGTELPADVVVLGIGAEPCVDWLAGSAITLRDGVLTDRRCMTNVSAVVAVGDCANSYRPSVDAPLRLEHWTNAVQQPTVAAAALLGSECAAAPHHEVPYFWSDQYGHRIQFAGHRATASMIEIIEGDVDAADFLAVYRNQVGSPVAVLAIDRARSFGRWRRQLATVKTG